MPYRSLVLVPNNASLRMSEAEYYVESGASGAIPAPEFDVLSLWVGRQLETHELLSGKAVRPVPDRLRLLALWERIVVEGRPEDWLHNDIASTAREAMEADRLVRHWYPDRSGPGMARAQFVGQRFDRWQRAYHGALSREEWRDETGRLEAFLRLVVRGDELPLAMPDRLILRGFVELTPLERSLLEALRSRRVEVVFEAPLGPDEETRSGRPPRMQAFRYRSFDDELRAAAQWSRDRVAEGMERVALALVGLDSHREAMARALMQTFHPAHALGLCQPGSGAFHVQGGLSLEAHPLIRAALDLLELSSVGLRQRQPFSRISRWILSPAWAGADSERSSRARLELFLRRREAWSLSLASVASVAAERDCPVLAERLSRLPRGGDRDETAAARLFRLLDYWGWPGPEATTPEAQLIVDALRSELETLEFAGIGNSELGLSLLRRRCRERRVQGPGGDLSPVQVLELQDIVGQRFEAVRVLGLHADQWPPPPKLNRLLPYAAARGLPGADSRRQRAQARAVFEGLERAAPRIEFSWAAITDGAPTAPSPLLAGSVLLEGAGDEALSVEGGVLARAAWPGVGTDAGAERDRLESLPRSSAPPVTIEGERVSGVVRLLNLQSACPWAAFLVRRLEAEFPPMPAPFPDRAFLGSLTHEAMRQLYGAHAGSGTLPRPGEIPGAVERALDSERAVRVLSPAARAAERARLEALLREWLAFEGEQTWPQPLAVERYVERDWQGMRVGVRMDRVDRLDEGLLVLDYKTGTPATPTWAQDRPVDVQLPLYAVLLSREERPALGIGWLHLRANEMRQALWTGSGGLKGRGVTSMGTNRAPFDSWEAALAHWEERLAGLLEEFREGVTTLEVHHPDALRYLDLDLLLRDAAPRVDGEDEDG
jgi:probable DNA repair protein